MIFIVIVVMLLMVILVMLVTIITIIILIILRGSGPIPPECKFLRPAAVQGSCGGAHAQVQLRKSCRATPTRPVRRCY